MLIMFYILIVLGVLLEGSADLLFRKWGLERQQGLGSWVFFTAALLIYMSGALCWGLSLQFRAVSRAIVAFAVLNVVMVAVAGVLLFNEHLSWVNRLGIALAVLSLILVEW
jgi:multidrug transporter EmrE-like cation transporter